MAFIQCVGSRDPSSGNEHCSSVCCMYAIKEAVIAKEHEHEIEPDIFYMDIRAHGKDFDRYVERAKKEYGIRFARARVSGSRAATRPRASSWWSTRTTPDTGQPRGVRPGGAVHRFPGRASSVRELGRHLGLPLNRHGFIATEPFNPVETKVPGIFVCGPAQEPKDIPETVMQASAGAAAAAEILAGSRWTEVEEKTYPGGTGCRARNPARSACSSATAASTSAPRCKVPEVVEYAKSLPDVVYAEENLYTCSQDTQEHIRDMIERARPEPGGRGLLHAADPRAAVPGDDPGGGAEPPPVRNGQHPRPVLLDPHGPARRSHATRPRTWCAWPWPRSGWWSRCRPFLWTSRSGALVIGGGPAGMSAALSLADQGFPVHSAGETKRGSAAT